MDAGNADTSSRGIICLYFCCCLFKGVLENKFQRYDWGSDDENLLKYGQSTPPEYALEQFFPKVALFIGSNDYLADPTDVQQLIDRLPVDKVVFKDVQVK